MSEMNAVSARVGRRSLCKPRSLQRAPRSGPEGLSLLPTPLTEAVLLFSLPMGVLAMAPATAQAEA